MSLQHFFLLLNVFFIPQLPNDALSVQHQLGAANVSRFSNIEPSRDTNLEMLQGGETVVSSAGAAAERSCKLTLLDIVNASLSGVYDSSLDVTVFAQSAYNFQLANSHTCSVLERFVVNAVSALFEGCYDAATEFSPHDFMSGVPVVEGGYLTFDGSSDFFSDVDSPAACYYRSVSKWFAEATFLEGGKKRRGSCGIFTTETYSGAAWADEMLYWTGVSSIDWYDVYLVEPGVEGFVELLQSGDNPVVIDMTSLRDMEQVYLSQAGTSRLFIPRPFVASPMYNALGTPWFLDYVHLSSWFFFMSMFVLVMWVTITMSLIARNIEARQPVRETRGFSRAQTGDGVTAVLPMTWSITMLMHASTHSVNFDENTAGTTFTLTVVAYQWGWNYYFPRDIVDIYWTTPKQVGHGHLEVCGTRQYYDKLLDYTRESIATKTTNLSKYSSKYGRNVAPNALSFYLKPSFMADDLVLPTIYSLAAFDETRLTGDNFLSNRALMSDTGLKLSARLIELLDESGVSLDKSQLAWRLDNNASVYQYITSSYPRLGNFKPGQLWQNLSLLQNQGITSATDVAADVSGVFDCITRQSLGLSLQSASSFVDESATSVDSFPLSANYLNFFFSKHAIRDEMLRYRAGEALRSKSTAVVSSNRLVLVHQNYLGWVDYLRLQLPTAGQSVPTTDNQTISLAGGLSFFFENWAVTQQFYSFVFRGLALHDAAATSVVTSPAARYNVGLFEQYDVATSNITVNTWLLFFNLERYLARHDSAWCDNYLQYSDIFSRWLDIFGLDFSGEMSTNLCVSQFSAVQRLTHSCTSLILDVNYAPQCVTGLSGSLSTVPGCVGLSAISSRLFLAASFNDLAGCLDAPYAVGSFWTRMFFTDFLTDKSQLNAALIQQFLTSTAPESTFLFYLSSLLTYEDFGTNFAPATKELMQRTFAYSSYQYFAALQQFSRLHSAAGSNEATLKSVGVADIFIFFFSDMAARQYINALAIPFQQQVLAKPNFFSVDESLVTHRTEWPIANMSSNLELTAGARATELSYLPYYLSFASLSDVASSSLYAASLTSILSNAGVFCCTGVAGIGATQVTWHTLPARLYGALSHSLYENGASLETILVASWMNAVAASFVDTFLASGAPLQTVTTVSADCVSFASTGSGLVSTVASAASFTLNQMCCGERLVVVTQREVAGLAAVRSTVAMLTPYVVLCNFFGFFYGDSNNVSPTFSANIRAAAGFNDAGVFDFKSNHVCIANLENTSELLGHTGGASGLLTSLVDANGLRGGIYRTSTGVICFSDALLPSSSAHTAAARDSQLFKEFTAGDYFLGDVSASHTIPLFSYDVAATTCFASTADVFSPTSVLTSSCVAVTDYRSISDHPVAATWYNNLDAGRPSRSSLAKNFEPAMFGAKFDGLPTLRLRFYRKSLFDWAQNWSSQVSSYAMPLYKTYRGGLTGKPNSGFWGANVSSAEYDQFVWSNFFIQLTKNVNFSFAPAAMARLNAVQPTKLFAQVLDLELVPIVKNQVIYLPAPHEEFDINYVYQHWTPEINTTRRSDHASRFRVTWSTFFSVAPQLLSTRAEMLVNGGDQVFTCARGAEFFKQSIGLLVRDDIFLENVVLQQSHTSITNNISPYFRQQSALRQVWDVTYFYQSRQPSLQQFGALAWVGLLGVFCSVTAEVAPDLACIDDAGVVVIRTAGRSYLHLLQLAQSVDISPYQPIVFGDDLTTTNWWSDLWAFWSRQPAYRQSDAVTHISDSRAYFVNRLLLLLSSHESELTRVSRALNLDTALGFSAHRNLLEHDLMATLDNLAGAFDSALGSDSRHGVGVREAGLFDRFIAEISGPLAHLALMATTKKNRSAYEFARCEVGAMRRLRVTKGICLPSDYPIHVICGSKDVIHSWAIPGLGIKIDCIPGYNSHRRVMFRWRGIYWGQCMEVCGRYHHWMPILVRIVHRDAFLSWCLVYLRALNSRSVTGLRAAQTSAITLQWLEDSQNVVRYDLMLHELMSGSSTIIFDALVESVVRR